MRAEATVSSRNDHRSDFQAVWRGRRGMSLRWLSLGLCALAFSIGRKHMSGSLDVDHCEQLWSVTGGTMAPFVRF